MKTILLVLVMQMQLLPADPKQPEAPERFRMEVKSQLAQEFGSKEACENAKTAWASHIASIPGTAVFAACAPYDIGKLEVIPKQKPQSDTPAVKGSGPKRSI